MTWLDDAIEGVRAHDRARPRSGQKAIGWSEAGGCRSAIGFRLDDAWAVPTDTWPAQRGTAIHDYLLPVLAGHVINGPADLSEVKEVLAASGRRIEVPTRYRGIPGHADLVDYRDSSVTDAKTTTLANAQAWAAKPSLLRQKRIQAHGYAAGLVDAGELPPDCTVRLLIIPVDGTFKDWLVFEEPFDPLLADEGANRVEWVRDQREAGEPLPKDKPRQWCETYCGFFDLCRTPGDDDGSDLITDQECADAVEAYGEAHLIAAPAQRIKEALAPLIRGLNGRTASGWKVTTSKPGAPGEKPDLEAIEADYAARGLKVPMVETPGKSASVTVTKIKDKEAAK